MLRALSPIKLPGFKPLAGAYGVNEFGNWFGEVALTVLVYNETGNVLATMALFLAMEFLPAFLGPAVTARVEVSGSRPSLPAIYLLQALAFLTLAGLAGQFSLTAVLFIAAIDGTLGIAGRSLARAATAEIVKPRNLLREGNALLNLSYTIAYAAGPFAAGLIVAGWSVRAAMLLNAASFLAAALVLMLSRSVPNVQAEPEHWYRRLADGLLFAGRHRLLRRLLVALFFAYMFFAVAAPAEILLVKEELGSGDAGYGFLLTAWGVGMVAGGAVFAAARKVPIVTLWVAGAIISGIGIGGLAAAPTLAVACVLALVAGLGNGIDWPASMSAAQAISPREFQARVVSLVVSIAALAPGIGFLIGGLVTSLASIQATFVLAGGGAIIAVAISLPGLRSAGGLARGTDGDPVPDVPFGP